ncbi:LacI family DNA-binding transcriptional regulator [Lentzea flaviverrucosa]|uniref:LacI family transcriptional regulator n=1 Tax=Lentzea flaviverrucosa TaxID=200379 RepID=A0A1H9GRU8_9PSEU|nr:LacI family DNA-binding transcriptional regulator [Lentzea flaviverrucosa]RDI34818.1 LacI family transcriptional regulator [Lentzea flaviverrucosa]SEQ52791.1 LacI family transcriptional regulator [Lentzea flaviverrucosa]
MGKPAPEAKPGATIYSVAEHAGVSIATVSRVLQGAAVVAEATRQKVLTAVDELGYTPLGAARSLAVRHHEAHGLVLPELSGPYYAELLMGFEARAAELDQSVVLVLTGSRTDLVAAVRQLATRVDAIAVFGSAAIPADVVRMLRAKKPVVVIAGEPHDGIEAVAAENLGSARELAGHVLDHGRRRVLFVGDPDSGPDVRNRHAGFVAAHRDRGLDAAEPVRVALSEADGAAFARRLLAGEHEADALMCANDELALSIMTALQDAGRDVPGDIAVVGWDDVMTSRYVRPGLTTVRQPVHELGALAASRLHELVSGEPPREDAQTLPTQLVVRSSCGCA